MLIVGRLAGADPEVLQDNLDDFLQQVHPETIGTNIAHGRKIRLFSAVLQPKQDQ